MFWTMVGVGVIGVLFVTKLVLFLSGVVVSVIEQVVV